jgi:hypothetical protein
MEGLAFILVLLVLALAATAPTREGLMAKGPYTGELDIPIPIPQTGWVSPWDIPSGTVNQKQPRPHTIHQDCAKVAGKLASFMCSVKGGVHLN